MRKPLVALAIVALLVLAVVTVPIPFVHELLLVLALYLLATEFESGRRWVKDVRRRWPFLSRWIVRAHASRWVPRFFGAFDDLTNPAA